MRLNTFLFHYFIEMTNMADIDYKAVIDGMKWEHAEKERELRAALESHGAEDRIAIQVHLRRLQEETPSELRATGLEQPVFYALHTRAAWEVLGLVDEIGARLRKEYGLHPTEQGGIDLDWHKLSERIWVPADYLEATIILPEYRGIFGHDEINCFSLPIPMTPAEQRVAKKVIYGPDTLGSGSAKIRALLGDPEWRDAAKFYCQYLLGRVGVRYRKSVRKDMQPVFDAMISDYAAQMSRP